MRLNRFLAAAGLGSRRSCEELIRTGQVSVNGVVCENLATTVEPTDVVKLGNRVLHTSTPVTLILNKPPGFLCTASDTHDRRTIFELLPSNFPRLFHVGRLDRDSEGLLIVTNDGDLALKLTHPRYKVDKEYEVVLDSAFDSELIPKLIDGINLEDGWAKAESVFKLGSNKLKVVLRQGMKRQIRLMFFALGYEVKRLTRVRIGPIGLQEMPAGSWRVLAKKEIDALLEEGAKTSAAEHTDRSVRPHRPAVHRPPIKRAWREGDERPNRPFKAAASGPRRDSRETHETSERYERPLHGASSRPASGRSEAIPFVPRASRGQEGSAEERPRPFRLGGRPGSKFAPRTGGKGFTSKKGKPTGKTTAKPASRPFAKFERRRRD